MRMKPVVIGEHIAIVEIDFFNMLLADFGKTMTREEIEQFLVDSWAEDDPTLSQEQINASVST